MSVNVGRIRPGTTTDSRAGHNLLLVVELALRLGRNPLSIEAAIVEHKMPAFAGYSKDIWMFVEVARGVTWHAVILASNLRALP